MAAHRVNPVDQIDDEGSIQQRQLLEFAKFHKQNPSLDGEEAVNCFLSTQQQQQQQQQQQSAAQSAVNLDAIQRSSAIQISGGSGMQAALPPSLALSGFRPESCPQPSTSMSLAGGQRMVRGNSTNPQHTSPQHAFARRAGRSPTQFTNTVPVPPTDPPLTQFTSAPIAPTFQALHSLGLDVTGNTSAALSEYLAQKDQNDPFPLALRSESFAGSRSNRGYPPPPLTIFPFSAPQMRSQPSSQLSSSYTDESAFLDMDLSAGSPQNKRSRSFSHGSGESEPYLFGHHEMSRQDSGASVFDAGFSMLRVRSSTGSMGEMFSDDIEDHLLSGVGGFAGNSEDLGRVAGQVVLKRPSEELDGGLSGRTDYYSLGSAGLKKQKMLKEEDLKGEESVVKPELMDREKLSGKKMVEEILQRPPLSPPVPKTTNSKQQGPKSEPRKPSNPISTNRQKPVTAPRPLPTIKPGKNPNTSPTLTTSTKSTYVRPPHPRVYCTKCTAHPEGFRGDHELRRHTDREHALTRKMWVIKDISKGKTLLAKCKACQSEKRYGVDYNAAAHLRRQHFKPKVRGGKGSRKAAAAAAAASAGTLEHSVPEMAELRKWMVEVEVNVPREKTSFKRGDHTTTTTSAITHQDESDTSEDNEDEDGNDGDGQDTDNQPNALDAFIQNIPLSGSLPSDGFAWTSWDNSASFNYDNQKILQHFAHQSGIQASAGAVSVPLSITGGVNQVQLQHTALHNSLLPAQQAVMMMMMHSNPQPGLQQMQQQLPCFAYEVDGSFGECLTGAGAGSAVSWHSY